MTSSKTCPRPDAAPQYPAELLDTGLPFCAALPDATWTPLVNAIRVRLPPQKFSEYRRKASQLDSGPAFSRIFSDAFEEIASGSKFFVLRMAFTASAAALHPQDHQPAASAALISSMGQTATLLQYVPRPFQNKVQHLFLNHYMNTYLRRRAASVRTARATAKESESGQFGFDQDFLRFPWPRGAARMGRSTRTGPTPPRSSPPKSRACPRARRLGP